MEGSFLYKNARISYSDCGSGTAVVLLHGFLENKNMWNPFLKDWGSRYRVVCIDLLGHGATDCVGYVHTMEEMAKAVHTVITGLKLDRVVLVGHSMGGYVSLAFAEMYAEMVGGLVLLNSTAVADSAERKSNRDRAIVAVKQSFGNFISLSIGNLFSEDNRNRLRGAIEDVKKEALRTPLQGVVAALEGMKMREDRLWLWQEGKFEKLLVLGKKDPVLNFDETSLQADGSNVGLVVFADGHMSHIENQVEVCEILMNFFDRI